jgi:hypothetical protein
VTTPSRPDLTEFVSRVAQTLYDGRPCSHSDGCHDHANCSSGCSPSGPCNCPRGPCCDPVEMGFDETHDNLFELVAEARSLLGLPALQPTG